MQQIKAYKPQSSSLSTGQVLHCAYTAEKAALIIREMADLLVLDLVKKKLTTNQIVLNIGYDIDNLADPGRRTAYKGKVTQDPYGRRIPRHAHGTANLNRHTSSTRGIVDAAAALYERIVDKTLLIRRINITACNLLPEDSAGLSSAGEQLDLFAAPVDTRTETEAQRREKRRQNAILTIQNKYGKNALVKGMNLEEGATTLARNGQIGGHKA